MTTDQVLRTNRAGERDEMLVVTLDRPAAHNAIDDELLAALHHALDAVVVEVAGDPLAIRVVLVTGGGSRLEGLFDLMRQRIPVPVEPGAVFSRVPHQLDEADVAAAEPLLAVAIGLALPEEER